MELRGNFWNLEEYKDAKNTFVDTPVTFSITTLIAVKDHEEM